jgi:glutamine---fructose-6-phosphate transaminase (isomerizing)
MCGIAGYTGHRQALGVVVEGLSRLEYRGYDSAGVAVLSGSELGWVKRAGKLGNLTSALAQGPPMPGTVGLGHTRWATHGPPTDPNAHPHTDCDGRLAVVHNGIIENFAVLRTELEAGGHELTSQTDTELEAGGHELTSQTDTELEAGGHELTSQTDTELAAHLLEEEMSSGPGAQGNGAARPGSLAAAMRTVCQRLEGAFTLVAVDTRDPEAVVGAPQFAAGRRPGRGRELSGQRRRRVCSRWWPRSRCRCSRASSPRPRDTTWTSPGTWPNRSPSSDLPGLAAGRARRPGLPA